MESLRVGVGAHPSLKNERSCGFGSDEALAARVRTPLLLLSAGNDPPNVQPGGAVARALAASGGHARAFPTMDHGWVTRGDVDDGAVAAEVERALEETLAFLREHV
ncbi:hypothetical protein EMIHUDRAFT_460887 [Emiliania huxleyi CCMP1516]|uniref:Dienelactone hydrolase domain-containing protein n=2 Tax=Emiliania huxleyi TaxID=2903 RepID=A0A0D3HXU6_EMIH1|nr:hypothetical protein EMIHUDRAFT_460887 [Emiliania huxleyi CCMP1516]EOD03831.1 hypothetical protein EMIHUDRAFT_460887 [Emiliania huxleyi CCMP1516]|eukprot:XP_005756260.1 hypothetical protein EMIHUDRAFT_460887 [Emiliania huxleyi CCMP1516]